MNSTMEFNNSHFMVDPHGVGDIAVIEDVATV